METATVLSFSLCLLHLLVAVKGQDGAISVCPQNDGPLRPRDCDGSITELSINVNHTLPQSILFPGTKFTCTGTVVSVTFAVRSRPHDQGQFALTDDKKAKLQVWTILSSMVQGRMDKSYTLKHEVVLTSPWCVEKEFEDQGDRRNVTMFNCTYKLPQMISIKVGDILGIMIPNNETESDVDLCFKTRPNRSRPSVCACAFNSTDKVITLSDCDCESQLSLALKVELHQDQSMFTSTSVTAFSTTGLPEEDTAAAIDHILGPIAVVAIIMVLIIIIIALIVILHYHRRKYSVSLSSSAQANNVYPNPVYQESHHLNGIESQDNAVNQLFNVDYDEISDEHRSEKASENCESKPDKSMSQSLRNNYFVLTQHQEQCPEWKNSGKCEQAQTIAANYEVYIPTNDRSVESGDERPKEMSDLDDTYWEPADSINELYKQLSSNKYREIPPHQVNLLGVLGSGEFGTVNKGSWESPLGAMGVAVKQLQPGASDEEKVKFLQEAAINGQFRHPNVVKLMGVVTTGETTMIVLELLSNGDLRSFLNKLQRSEIPNACGDQQGLLKFCQQVASGMEYLSNKDYVHRDLAARNILVSGDHVCKISDFGMSRNLMDEDYYVSHGGRIPVKWTAPEAIHYKKHSSASDVWSFGCVMYEIWSLGHKPFESYTNPDVIRMVDKGYRLPPPPGLSKELYKIMMQCWKPKSSHRPTFTQLVEMLSRADFELFVWKEEDLRDTDPRVKDIGAPLEVAEKLYLDIQNMYK